MSDDPRQRSIPEELRLTGFGAPPSAEDAYVAPGRAAEHEWGVHYQGSFEGEADGTARAVRLHARALNAAGIPVFLQSFTGKFRGRDGSIQPASATSERVKQEVQHLMHPSIGTLRVRIRHAVIQHADFLRSWVIPRSVTLEQDTALAQDMMRTLYATTIIYSVWERSVIDPNITGLLRRVAECWVPSEHNAKLLRDHGVERVTVVPHPWEADSPLARGIERKPLSGARFYAIGIWQPRKGFHELLGAFLCAFRPTDDVRLTIKYQEFNWPGYPTPDESIWHWLADERVRANGWQPEKLGERISLLAKHLSEADIQALHFENNVYVACSHGEAFCLPAFDAKLCGNRLIHVPWGGTADFEDALDSPLGFKMEPVPASYRWGERAMWASLDFDGLITAMRAQALGTPIRYQRGPKLEAYTLERVGKLMRERVEAVLERSRR